MTLNLSKVATDWQGPQGGNGGALAVGSPVAGPEAPTGGVQQTTVLEAATATPPMTTVEEARARLGRMKLNAIKEELRRAELRFLAAKRSLGDAQARDAAGRIADALGRANLAIDSIEKGVAVHPALEALLGVSRFDPTTRQADFGQLSGQSLVLVGKVLEGCGIDSIAYWGRTLTKLARTLLAVQLGHAA
jgi:hypothetical protein